MTIYYLIGWHSEDFQQVVLSCLKKKLLHLLYCYIYLFFKLKMGALIKIGHHVAFKN